MGFRGRDTERARGLRRAATPAERRLWDVLRGSQLGSSYYAAPVVVTGADREGRPVRIAGEAVMRNLEGVRMRILEVLAGG
jgi:very-short-patch-repair endonuclease